MNIAHPTVVTLVRVAIVALPMDEAMPDFSRAACVQLTLQGW